MQTSELIARLEAATGWDGDLDLALAEWAFANRIPIAFYGGPINYDPRLWIERHGWEPTASIDAALTLADDQRAVTREAIRWLGKRFQLLTNSWPAGQNYSQWLALAICIASLRARNEGEGA